MNKYETAQAIFVMQAFADGKEVEFNAGTGWLPVSRDECSWNFACRRYRLKPDPIVAYILFDGDQPVLNGTHFDELLATRAAANPYYPQIKVVKFIEVTE